jgi:hypothetical protein
MLVEERVSETVGGGVSETTTATDDTDAIQPKSMELRNSADG